MYYEWLKDYGSEQIQPSFPWLWMAKMYARHDSIKNPDCIAQVFRSSDNELIIQYKQGIKIS